MQIEEFVEGEPRVIELTNRQIGDLERLSVQLGNSRAWWGDDRTDPDRAPPRIAELDRLSEGRARVRIRNVVGVLAVPGLELIVAPKIPSRHFLYLLESALLGAVRHERESAALSAGSHLRRLVARWYADALERLLGRGLAKGYVAEEMELDHIRGRINSGSMLRSWYAGRVRVTCEFDEFSEDTPANRYLAYACQLLMAGGAVNEDDLTRLRGISARLPDVVRIQNPELPTLNRRESQYREAVSLAHDIITATGRDFGGGNRTSSTFAIYTPRVVEDGIRNALKLTLHPFLVRKTGGRRLMPSFVMVRPDLELGPPPFTGDVKYKLGSTSWNRADLAQAVLFATAYRSPRAVVIDFVDSDSPREVRLDVGALTVHRVAWRCGPGWSPSDSLRELTSAIEASILNPEEVAIRQRAHHTM